MRLTTPEVAAIRDCAARHFGPGAVVRLFGSRTRDDLHGGDIDLHVTLEPGSGISFRAEVAFKEDLQQKIGEQRIDLVVRDAADPETTFDRIALMTGLVLGERPSGIRVGEDSMLRAAYRDVLSEALAAADLLKAHLDSAIPRLARLMPMDAARVATQSEDDRMATSSLLLLFSTMVATVQDQLGRTILLAEGRAVAGQSRAEQRLLLIELGALPAGADFQPLAILRNKIAHSYPTDPGRQAAMVNDVFAAIPALVACVDALSVYGRRILDVGRDPP